MVAPGFLRRRLASTLNAAYADGLLSQATLVHRLEQLFAGPLVDPAGLIGDLPDSRRPTAVLERISATFRTLRRGALCGWREQPASMLLALDWAGGRDELLIGRHPGCEIVLSGSAVSRRHARLSFRDGSWILQDLHSTNGTILNGHPIGRCQLHPGDHLLIGEQQLLID
jgi:hypothetical protein